MHPILTRATRVALYLVVCLEAAVLLAAFLRLIEPRPWAHALAFAVPSMLLYGFVVLSAWWVCRSYPLTGGRAARSIATQVGAALLASTAWTIFGSGLATVLRNHAGIGPSTEGLRHDLIVIFAFGVALYLLSAVVHYLGLAFQTSHAAERRALESQVGAREAELRALRAQLSPHFLFNSLNSINALVGNDPEGARRMCEKLGDFLRRTLALGARDAVTVAEELALVDGYLDIEQVRFGDRLRVERAIDPGAAGCNVPPLLLQPLVENAVKHGIQGCLEGGVVRLEARRDLDRLTLAVENPVDPEAPSRTGGGVGLVNVRRRLEIFGAREAQIVAGRTGASFRVTLTLPAREATSEESGNG